MEVGYVVQLILRGMPQHKNFFDQSAPEITPSYHNFALSQDYMDIHLLPAGEGDRIFLDDNLLREYTSTITAGNRTTRAFIVLLILLKPLLNLSSS